MAYIDIHDQPGAHRDFFDLPAVAVGSFGDEYPIWHAPFKAKIRYVAVVVGEGGLTGHAVNYTQILTYDKGTDGTGATVLETKNCNAAAQEFDSFLIYEPAAYDDVASGTVLSVQYVAAAAGEDMPMMHGYVEYEGA